LIAFPNDVTKDTVAGSPVDSTNTAGVYKRALLAQNRESLYEQAEDLETSGN
jgi:hypothetical protein